MRQLLLFRAGTVGSMSAMGAPTPERPTVIRINADDLGIGMLGCYGQELVKTPTIDRLADEGMKFNNYYGGLILRELKTLGIDEQTIVVFTSDNGHELYYGPKSTFPRRRSDGEETNLTDRKWRTSECGDVFDGAGGRAGLKRTTYQGGMRSSRGPWSSSWIIDS